jgi:drug/metabolite transporter (DMT)-like permease
MERPWLPLVYLVILGASWGLHFSFIKLAAESGLSYLGIAAVTTAGVTLLLVLTALVRRRFPVFDRAHLRFYFVCALLAYVVPFLLELQSAAHLPASVLTLIVSSTPLFTVALAIAFRSDTVSLSRLLGIVFGTLSTALILVPAALGISDIPIFWVLVAFIVPLSYSADHIYIAKAWPQGSDSYQLGCGEALLALAMLAPAYLLQGVGGDLNVPFGVGHIAMIVMVGFALVEIFLYFEILRIAGPIFTSQTNFVTVVSGVFWAMIIFDERPSKWLWLSAALLGIALYFVATGSRRPHNDQTPR